MIDRSPARTGWVRGWPADVAVVLGALCLVLGVVAGYVNRTLLDTDRFATSVDEIRRDPVVSAVLGRALTDAILKQQPDAVAVRPLVDSVAAALVGSDLLSGPTKAAAANFQRSLTEPSAQVFLLRVADAGAVVTAVLQRVAPAGTVSADSAVPLYLAQIGSQSFAGRTIALARFVGVARWALPTAGVALMAAGTILARGRRRAVLVGGVALMALAGTLALALLAGATWADAQNDATVTGALIRHGWPVLVAPVWWSVAAVAAVGLLLVSSAAALVPDVDPAAVLRRGWALMRTTPRRTSLQILRAVALLAAGVSAVLRPLAAAAIVGVLAGCWLALQGIHELAAATSEEQDGRAVRRRARRVAQPVGAAALGVLVLVVTWGATPASPASTSSAQGAVAGRAEVCNGYASLCDRQYPQVAYAASHNAMATASDPSWFIPEQGLSIVGQLDHGVRALLIDVWPGFPTTQGRVATARSAYAEGKAQLERELGREVVAAGLRVIDAVTNPSPAGPEALYLCHGLCELGATSFEPEMAAVKVWLDTHPDEVLTVIVQDHVPAAEIGALLVASGLADYAAVPPPAEGTWPTLREMITSAKRLYVLLEAGDGGTTYPWLANAYQRLVQETPYGAATLADLRGCPPNRGRSDAPLLLMNHWLSGFGQLVSNARAANATSVLGTRAQLCRTERQLPNFLAVNYAEIGDLHAVVRKLNGVG